MDYKPPVNSTPNYMGWGTNNQTQNAAAKVDAIADKANFALSILDSAVQGFDAIEKELVEMAAAPHPPQSTQIRAIAHRIDAQQQQLRDVVLNLKNMMQEIDKTTDQIQQNRTTW